MTADVKNRNDAAFGQLRLMLASPEYKRKMPPAVVEAVTSANDNGKRQRQQFGFTPGEASFSVGSSRPKAKKYFAKTKPPMQVG